MDPDRALVEAAAAGSREAFDELVRRHQSAMLTLARVLTGGRGDADDLAQDVFVRAWRSLRGFRGDSTFRTWLHRVAINVVRTSQAKQGRVMRLFVSRQSEEDEPFDPPARAFACSSVKLLDVLPLRPGGVFTRAATLRPTRSLDSACRIARSSEFRVIWSDRVE